MRLHRFPSVAALGVLVLTTTASAAPFSRAAQAHPGVTLMAADPDKKDTDKKEEEPKGDPVDVDKLPKAVVEAVKVDMPGARITKASKLEDGNYYLDDVKVGKKLWDVTITPKGKIIKKVEMRENG